MRRVHQVRVGRRDGTMFRPTKLVLIRGASGITSPVAERTNPHRGAANTFCLVEVDGKQGKGKCLYRQGCQRSYSGWNLGVSGSDIGRKLHTARIQWIGLATCVLGCTRAKGLGSWCVDSVSGTAHRDCTRTLDLQDEVGSLPDRAHGDTR